MKLVFAAPASGLPLLPTAFDSQSSFWHFVMKLDFAAPAKGLPFLPTALPFADDWAKALAVANIRTVVAE